ncbi:MULTISPECIES: LLM class flavin-dependent oxidoreductase [unclassified Microbacterium]|uniref:LLM class flavin-dependent oxidoreductase n=1 Tax=unclassified Microbacterium TaxID=2609290 RepID=UPI000C2C2B87|nr:MULTISPECIES: LLM class flavin-dependent oxidoreductase [unclassified Microbacterium]
MSDNNRLQLGTFGTNLAPGITFTTIPGALTTEWSRVRHLALAAEAMDFEAIVPISRWKGYGGEHNPHSDAYETLTWAAAVGAVTKSARIFATVSMPIVHPVIAAKQLATIDHVTGGRAGVNVLGGWYRPEMPMFGGDLLEHDARYDMADEWIDIVRRLWTESDEFDVAGDYFQLQGLFSMPKPLGARPRIMNAAMSGRGLDFALQNSDVIYVKLRDDRDAAAAQVADIKGQARERFGREIEVWTFGYVVDGDTEKDARDFLHHYAQEHGMHDAAINALTIMGMEAAVAGDNSTAARRFNWVAGDGGVPLIGTPAQVADGLEWLADVGIDGCLLGWPLWESGMARFETDILPLLRERGLRSA